MRTRKNKAETGEIILLAAVGVAVWGYFQGWFAGFGLGPAASTATTSTKTSSGTTSTTTVSAPALGTTVTSAAQVSAQAAANDPYILPDANTFGAYVAAPLPGYSAFYLSDKGNVLLRADVAIAANQQVGATGQMLSLSGLQSLMTAKGLSGFGQYTHYLSTRMGRR